MEKLNALLEKLRHMGPMKARTLRCLIQDRNTQRQKWIYYGFFALSAIAIFIDGLERQPLFLKSQWFDFMHTAKLFLSILALFTILVFFYLGLKNSNDLFDTNFKKFLLETQHNHAHIAELLCQKTEILQRARQHLRFKREYEASWANTLGGGKDKAIPLFFTSALLLLPIALNNLWTDYMTVCIYILVLISVPVIASMLLHGIIVRRYIYLEELITQALDYQAKEVTLPRLHIVSNVSLWTRRYLKTKSAIGQIIRK